MESMLLLIRSLAVVRSAVLVLTSKMFSGRCEDLLAASGGEMADLVAGVPRQD